MDISPNDSNNAGTDKKIMPDMYKLLRGDVDMGKLDRIVLFNIALLLPPVERSKFIHMCKIRYYRLPQHADLNHKKERIRLLIVINPTNSNEAIYMKPIIIFSISNMSHNNRKKFIKSCLHDYTQMCIRNKIKIEVSPISNNAI